MLIIPIAAAALSASGVIYRRPTPTAESALQYVAAGGIFAAVAGEVLPDLKHNGSLWAIAIGGAIGVALMLGQKRLEGRFKEATGVLAIVAINLVVNGLVLGMSFVARAEVGLLMLIAVTLQTLFLSLIAAADVARSERAPGQIILLTVSLALMLPIGSLLALPVAVMRSPLQEGFLAFGFIALLYLIAEQVFANARDVPDKPWVAAMFFVGFLALLIVEEALG